MAGFVRRSIDDYTSQVNTYDAGRPNTPSGSKLGTRVIANDAPQFDPSYDHKVNSFAGAGAGADGAMPTMASAVTNARPIQSYRGDGMAALAESKSPVNVVRTIRMDQAQRASDAGNIERTLGVGPGDPNFMLKHNAEMQRRMQVPTPPAQAQPSAPAIAGKGDAQTGQGAPAPSGNAYSGNYAADGPNGQGIYRDPATGKISIRLTGDEGGKFMANRMMTARPSGMLSVTPASTGTAPARTIGEYSGMYAGGSELDKAEAALQKRQAEVYEAERSNPNLLTAPGSNSYIDPSLSPEQQQARQIAIDQQEQANRRAVLDRTVAENATNNAVLASKGLPTRKIDPQAVDLSTQGADRKLKADMASAEQAGATQRTMMTDETQRRGQDMELANRDVQRAADAEEGTANRAAQIEAAKITADARPKAKTTQDEVKMEAVKAFLKAVSDPMNQRTREDLLAMYGLEEKDVSGPTPPPNRTPFN